MRVALTLLLINGLVPALGELVEAAVHCAVEGHLAHTAADCGDLGDQGHEHGCGTTEHLCSCCTSQPVIAAPAVAALALSRAPREATVVRERLQSLHEPPPPYRPPIPS